MDLFVINRYTGDDPVEKTPNKEKLMKKLQKKIKKRKRINESINDELNNFSQTQEPETEAANDTFNQNENAEPKRKRKKSKNVDDELDSTSHSISELPNGTESPDKIIKKKKKIKKNEQEEDIMEDNGISINGTNENVTENEKKQSGFTVLGDVQVSKREKVKRKLPNWLANPSVVSVDLKNLTCSVDSIPQLDKMFVENLKKNKITHFFPVQSQIIPWLLKNAERPRMYWSNDICVSAPTGSGKTLAFVLPILQILHKRVVPKIRAIVVLPVHELANQVFSVFKTYSEPTNLNVLLLTKERPFHEEQSLICKRDGLGNYKTLVDILVTTPGRLVDHLKKTEGLCFDDLRYLVIDEADKVMENVQNNWLYHLNKYMSSECIRSYEVPVVSYNNMINKKRPPNKLLFSATLSQDPEKLQQLGLFQPKLFTSIVKSETSSGNVHMSESKFIGKYTTPAELTEYYVQSSKANKPLMLHHLLKTRCWNNVLCFVNSTEATSRLAFVLKSLSENKRKIDILSADLSITKKNTVLQKFSSGKINVLISSDALARGIDIPVVQCVISYDAPKYIKTYIHRIGRTSRGGKQGTSVALLTKIEENLFKKMIETAGKTVERLNINEEELEVYQSSYEEALNSLETFVEKKKQKSIRMKKNKRSGKQRKKYLIKKKIKRRIIKNKT